MPQNILQILINEIQNDHSVENLVSKLKVEKDYYEPEQDRQWYEGHHDITRRSPKLVERTRDDGKKEQVQVEMNKLVFNYPQKIVETAIAFLFGEEATIERTGEIEDDQLYTDFSKV